MTHQYIQPDSQEPPSNSEHDQRSLNEMLQELRVLQQGSQILVGFFVLLPFSEGFVKISEFERWVYIVAFISSIITLICFSAPAAQHRIERPLRHRVKFKLQSNRIIVAGTVALSIALISTTQLVSNEALGSELSGIATAVVGFLIVAIWWLMPLSQRSKG
jgi:accessory gene regulator protein AgrB